MSKDTKAILIGGLLFAALVIGFAVYSVKGTSSGPGELDAFATCLKNSGAQFYGAFWCPHCQAQKALFGKSVKLLPYVECSNPDGQTQNATCNAKGIQGYPTWIFADGSQLSGEQTLATLSEKTNCPINAGETSVATSTIIQGASSTAPITR